jgi:hypothetical protein
MKHNKRKRPNAGNPAGTAGKEKTPNRVETSSSNTIRTTIILEALGWARVMIEALLRLAGPRP